MILRLLAAFCLARAEHHQDAAWECEDNSARARHIEARDRWFARMDAIDGGGAP